ncbi:Mad3/BUB1 homology region 1-domain-containing protein [Gautieria morchelliformis]|nr:Mad3/BUB1 homology region 1-domain-containing protein [Gautieria morchelliformis]
MSRDTRGSISVMQLTTPSPTLDDVFNDGQNHNELVDADVIEAVKENIQPLQQGRRATALSAIFSTPLVQRDTILSRKRARFRLQVTQALEDVDEDEGCEDPLDVYSRFVAWTLESYPQGQSAESGLMELLEEATRQLKGRDKYKQDPRYLKLWTLYAGYVEKPAVVYSYLLANEIGTDFSQLYEAFAHVLERDGRGREADEMYILGIARNAEPLEHLKKRYADFQRRMLAAPLPLPPSPPRSTGAPTIGRRTVLGETSSRPSHPTGTQVDVFSVPQPNARLQIFVDPTSEKADGNKFPDVGTRVSRTKENRPEIHKMGDGPLSRSRGTQRIISAPASRITPFRDPPARVAFVPFRDDEDASAMPPPAASYKRTASTSWLGMPTDADPPATPGSRFTPYRDEGVHETPRRPSMLTARAKKGEIASEAEALRRDPFKNYGVQPYDV